MLVALVIPGGPGTGVVWTNCDAMARAGQLSMSLGNAGSYKEVGDMLGPLAVGGVSQLFGLAIRFVACGILGMVGTALIVRRQAG